MTEIKAKKVIFKNRDGEYLLPMTEDKTGLVLFDTILKDHILTYEESKGLALQGTYVYKEAIAGSRYGYADFYNKCIEELNNSSNEQRYLKSNITKVGSVVDNQGVLSGFSASNYATTPIAPTTVTSYEWVCKFTVGNNITTQQGILANLATNRDTPQIFVSEDSKIHFLHPINASTWSSVIYTNLTANTTYWVKATWDGSTVSLYYKTSSNGTYALAGTTSASTINWTAKVGIGIDTPSYPFLGSIDLKESYININGERWWTGVDSLEYKKNPNGHLFYDITQKDIVDDLFEQTGMAWFYGIDQENERIFLPRNNYFEQATADVSEINTHVEAGLPDHYHTVTMKRAQKSGQGTKTVWSYAENDQGYGTVTSDLASVANPIYSNSDTVQPNAVKKLLYICVGNTVADTSWVNVVTQVANGAKDIEDKRVQALTDLTNKENAGLSALANASNALRTTQITNCITEIPQSIKYNLLPARTVNTPSVKLYLILCGISVIQLVI